MHSAQLMQAGDRPSRISMSTGQTFTHARHSRHWSFLLGSNAITRVLRSYRTLCIFAYGQTVAQNLRRSSQRFRNMITESDIHIPQMTGPSSPAVSLGKNSYGETKNHIRSAPTTILISIRSKSPPARPAGPRFSPFPSANEVKSESTVWGHTHPHHILPNTSVMKIIRKVTNKSAMSTRKNSSIQILVPKK